MNKTIAVIASLFIATIFVSCAKHLVQENYTLEARLKEKAKHINGLTAEMEQKRLETSRLKADIADRNNRIEALRAMLLFGKADNEELRKQVQQLTYINSQQKRQLDMQAEQLKALKDSLRTAKRDRDFWSEKFHSTIHGTARIIEMKDGIIARQRKAIEEQNEQMIKHIQLRDAARRMIIHELPR